MIFSKHIIFLFCLLCFVVLTQAALAGCLDVPQQYSVVTASDYDGDGVANDKDNCLFIKNPKQEDVNNDWVGDACDPDEDGLANHCDNCVSVSNPDQTDANNNGVGDVCELALTKNIERLSKHKTNKESQQKKFSFLKKSIAQKNSTTFKTGRLTLKPSATKKNKPKNHHQTRQQETELAVDFSEFEDD